jgi:hypothetical protein
MSPGVLQSSEHCSLCWQEAWPWYCGDLSAAARVARNVFLFYFVSFRNAFETFRDSGASVRNGRETICSAGQQQNGINYQSLIAVI